MGRVFISPNAARAEAGLARSLETLGWPVTISATAALASHDRAVVALGDRVPVGGRVIEIEASHEVGLQIAPARQNVHARLRFGAGDRLFGHALLGELLRPEGAPAAADPESRALVALAERVAQSEVTVLVSGPTGTGKEVLARWIHRSSARAKGPLLAINCAALPEHMLEAILFGHERGAFTGATGASTGLFRAANGGTLMLDEIAEMPLGLQAKLLRVLQEREVLPVGATAHQPIDVRLIACCGRDLKREADEGRFRPDLYYRLSVFPLATAPLSARRADVRAIAASLLLRHAGEGGRVAWPTAAAIERLEEHDWPGNVRELDNVLQRALVLAGDARIDVEHIRFDAAASPAAREDEPGIAVVEEGRTLDQMVRAREHAVIRATLAACAGRRAEVAGRLGISERTLRYKLAEMAAASARTGAEQRVSA